MNKINTFPMGVFQARGFCFHGGDIWLASQSDAVLEQMDKTTGAVIFDHPCGTPFAWLALYDAAGDQFWTSTAGAGAEFNVSNYDGSGGLLANPLVGRNPYGQCMAGGDYAVFCYGDDSMWTVSGGVPAGPLAVPGAPSTGTGAACFDGANIWTTVQPNTLVKVTGGVVTNIVIPGMGQWGGLILANGSLWATDNINDLLFQIDLTGAVVNTFPILGGGPLAWDGANFWILVGFTLVVAYDAAGNFLASNVVSGAAGTGQWISTDGIQGSGEFLPGTPNQAWTTSGNGPGQVDQFELVFTPPPGGSGGFVEGTHVGFMTEGHVSGGTK